MADRYLREKLKHETPTLKIPSPEVVGQLQEELDAQRRERDSYGDLAKWGIGGRSGMLPTYLRSQSQQAKRSARDTEQQLRKDKKRLKAFQGLQESYLRQGSTCL